MFAGNEWQRNYITKTFEGIDTIHLNGYDVSYSKKGSGFRTHLLRQLPRLLKTIRQEQEWLRKTVIEKKIDAVISDNRYGLHHPTLPSVLMTHQVMAQTGMGAFADKLLSKIHYKHIQKYQHCWVIDVAGMPNLSGSLAHPPQLPSNARFIGLLSQIAEEDLNHFSEEHLLILLSGPEPQRSILSDIIWEQVKDLHRKIIFVEGSNNISERKEIPSHISYHRQITKQTLLPLLKAASVVVCRSGYSTLMDLSAMGKKAILIPTPGQTEQEYLGTHLHQQGVFFSMNQRGFELQKALEECSDFPFKKLPLQNGWQQYKPIVDQWLQQMV